MKLLSLDFAERTGMNLPWKLEELSLANVNLLVGKNATGKTRTIAAIQMLAKVLAGEQPIPPDISITAIFDHQGARYDYRLQSRGRSLERELLLVDEQVRVDRGPGGTGKIFAKDFNKLIRVQTPQEQAAVARVDSIQHPFLDPLNAWAKSLHFFPFAGDVGQDRLLIPVTDPALVQPSDSKEANRVVETYLQASQSPRGEEFREQVKQGMASLGYPLEEIRFSTLPSDAAWQGATLPPPTSAIGTPHVLLFREVDLHGFVPQIAVSQGMFRAFAAIVYVVNAVLNGKPSCILIDDIGEGLDFERSCALIELLMEKTKDSSVQLVMSTNDRFVMNAVPLENWCVLQRSGTTCRVHNYRNSQPVFDRFKFTGLNNFDFLAVDFLNMEPVPHE